jgi:hypothetical protein
MKEISEALANSNCSGAVIIMEVSPTIVPFKTSFISWME